MGGCRRTVIYFYRVTNQALDYFLGRTSLRTAGVNLLLIPHMLLILDAPSSCEMLQLSHFSCLHAIETLACSQTFHILLRLTLMPFSRPHIEQIRLAKNYTITVKRNSEPHRQSTAERVEQERHHHQSKQNRNHSRASSITRTLLTCVPAPPQTNVRGRRHKSEKQRWLPT